MKPIAALLGSLASIFASQKAPPQGFPEAKKPEPEAPRAFGAVVFSPSSKLRARRNETPGDGRGPYLDERHPSPPGLAQRLSRIGRKAEHGTTGSVKTQLRRVREIQCAVGHLEWKRGRKAEIADRRHPGAPA